jgi:hypothetical protein
MEICHVAGSHRCHASDAAGQKPAGHGDADSGLRGDGTATGRLPKKVRERPADLGADTTHAEVETVGGKEEEKAGQVRNGVEMTRESRPYPHVHVTAQCRPAEYVWKHPRLSSTGPPPSCSPFEVYPGRLLAASCRRQRSAGHAARAADEEEATDTPSPTTAAGFTERPVGAQPILKFVWGTRSRA